MSARTPKEAVYDEHISPLMAQIIALCKEHRINMHADFSLGYIADEDRTLFCTTCLPIDTDDTKGHERINRLSSAARTQPTFVAYTIMSGRKS